MSYEGKMTQNGLWKFPRTKHLFDAGGGAVSRDDLLMSSREAVAFLRGNIIAAEEKVDGANIGISIDSNYQFKVQNRSHYVNSQSHKQFGQLDTWLSTNESDLRRILTPNKHVLFGEWLCVKHSIHYTDLPSLLLVFDVFDAEKGKYLSRRSRDNMLADSELHAVPLIAEGTFANRDEVLKLLETKSKYYDGVVEGIYLRIDDDTTNRTDSANNGYLKSRAKVVRPDFLQNITETWTKQKFTKNIVKYY